MKTNRAVLVVMALYLLTTPLFSAESPRSPKVADRLKAWIAAHPDQDMVKVWVFFKDKGMNDIHELKAALEQRKKELGPRTLLRRAKVRKGSLVDERDLPVYSAYKDAVLALCPNHRADSGLLNAVSLNAPFSVLDRLAALDCVKSIEKMATSGRKRAIPGAGPAPLTSNTKSGRGFNYGSSASQLDQINVPALHDLGLSGDGVIVCMMDTGFYKDHEAFSQLHVLAEWDFINDDSNTQNEAGDPSSQHDHGTYTWSALGGLKDGELYGPAFGASFLLAKTEDTSQEQPIEEDWWTEGIQWAEGLGADVVSSSLIYRDWYTFKDMDGKTAVTTKAANWAVEQGVVVVNAMGNEGHYAGAIGAPADSDGVVSCGAVDSSGYIASFSSTGPTYDGRTKPDVCALGIYTYCAVPWGTDTYGYASGTSLSTPLVGGAAALLLEANPHWTPADLKAALHQTASQSTSPDNYYGWGVVNTYDAACCQGFYPLERDTFVMSEGLGGVVNFTLDSGSVHGNRNYLLFGGVSGTEPGIPLPGGHVTLPLNWDIFTNLVLTMANGPVFQNFMGTLDGSGTAGAKLDTYGPIAGGAGITLYFAYALNNQWDYVSNPVTVKIVP